MPESSNYNVSIPYREPTYAKKQGEVPAELYRTRYTVRAAGVEDAISKAVAQFKDNAKNSSVGWVREIDADGIRVERLES